MRDPLDDGNGRMSRLLTLLLPLARRENDYVSFVTYQLGVILAAYRELSERVRMVAGNTRKPNRVRDIIKGHLGKITKAGIMTQCPDISQTTIQRALNERIKSGEIIKIGGGRCTSYTWNRENDELC